MVSWLLILIYSGMIIDTETYSSKTECLSHSYRIDEQFKVKYWDNMAGSNPVPKVVIAYCVEGIAKSNDQK